MHVHDGSFAIELAFVLGALHALEPGHGKTALFAYMLNGKKRPIHSVVMGLASGLSHTASIMGFAFVAHLASHMLTHGHDETMVLTQLFTWLSGVLMLGIGAYLLWRVLWPKAVTFVPASSCGCPIHRAGSGNAVHDHGSANAAQSLSLSALLGMSGGLMPCPSALATYLSGLSSGNTAEGFFSILIYASGIAVSITLIGWAFHLIGEKAQHLVRRRSYTRWIGYVQAGSIFGIGVFYTARAVAATMGLFQ